MSGPFRLPAFALLLALAAAGAPSAQALSPCTGADPCGVVHAWNQPTVLSWSAAEGEATGPAVAWEHCLHTLMPDTLTCESLQAPAYAGVLTGPHALCAKGVLRADGAIVAETTWQC